MARASASTCKAAEKDTPSIATIGYSNSWTSEQWIRESQYHAQAEEDKSFACCFGWFPSFTSLFPTTAPKKRPDSPDRLSLQCAGDTEPSVVNSPTNKLDYSTHLHTCASCEESFSGSYPHRANTYKCPRTAIDEEKPNLYIKNTQHDSSINPDTEGLSSTSSPLAKETARIWDIYERRALHYGQILENTLPSIRKSAGQALETPRTATNDDDSQLASSVDQLSTVGFLGDFIESKCELGQTFNFKGNCILVTTEIIVGTTESRNTLVAALLAFRRIIAKHQNL